MKMTKAWGTYDRNGNLLPNAGPKQTNYTPIEVVIVEQNWLSKYDKYKKALEEIVSIGQYASSNDLFEIAKNAMTPK